VLSDTHAQVVFEALNRFASGPKVILPRSRRLLHSCRVMLRKNDQKEKQRQMTQESLL
jgi:hypothetical protein